MSIPLFCGDVACLNIKQSLSFLIEGIIAEVTQELIVGPITGSSAKRWMGSLHRDIDINVNKLTLILLLKLEPFAFGSFKVLLHI